MWASPCGVWLSRTFGGAQSRRDEAQRLGSAAPLSIFRAAPIAKWQQEARLPQNSITSNGITALGLLPFHQKCGRATSKGEDHDNDQANDVDDVVHAMLPTSGQLPMRP